MVIARTWFVYERPSTHRPTGAEAPPRRFPSFAENGQDINERGTASVGRNA